jgi:hypothetical protein
MHFSLTFCHFLSLSVSSPLEQNILLIPSFLKHRHPMPFSEAFKDEAQTALFKDAVRTAL